MRIRPFFLFLFLAQLASGTLAAQDSTAVRSAATLINTIQKKYAPDKRTAIFKASFNADDPALIELETTDSGAASELAVKLKESGLPFRVDQEILPSQQLEGKIFGVANLSVCNNRTSPDHAAEMATQMLLGTPVDVLKKERGYYQVRTPDRYISYIDGAGVTLMDEAAFNEWKAAPKVIYTADYGYSFQEPTEKSMRVSDLVAGDLLKLVGKEKGFYKVGYPDGRTAFIPVKSAADFRTWASRPNPTAEQILETAKTMVGVPYLWGGTSVKGVDCSGFTKTSYFLNGIILPRDASQQALVGEQVDIFEADTVNLDKALKNLRAGDLLFFAAGKVRAASKPRVTHTAIYIGDGIFIQAAGLVRINSMKPESDRYDDFQARTIVGARRMLTAIGQPEVVRVDHHKYYQSQK
ncbi:MAG TPA: C40 family peptidase [Sphingobacteriaceae bacterium]